MKAERWVTAILFLSFAPAQAQEPLSEKMNVAARCAASLLERQPGVISARWHATDRTGSKTSFELRDHRGEITIRFAPWLSVAGITSPTPEQQAQSARLAGTVWFSFDRTGHDAPIALELYAALISGQCQAREYKRNCVTILKGVRAPV